MTQIFVSYSRADEQFIKQFIPLIRRVYGRDSVWYDDEIYGGYDWWEMILSNIADCELFIYLISKESLESPYCQAELREAARLQKQILPVIVRRLQPPYPGNTESDIAFILRRTQYVDLSGGFNDANQNSILYGSINQLIQQAPETPPVPILPTPIPQPPVTDKPQPDSNIKGAYIGGGFLIVSVIIAGLFGLFQGVFANPAPTQTSTTQVVAQTNRDSVEVDLSSTPTEIPMDDPTEISTNTPLPTDEPTHTAFPTNEPTLIPTDTLDPETIAQAVFFENQTATAQAIIDNQTATATQWTQTPSPTPTPTENVTQTIEALLTQWVEGTQTAQAIIDATATATLWTATPTITPTPTDTLTPTTTPTSPPNPIDLAIQRALAGVSSNEEWEAWYPEGFVQEFDGVEMLLVPTGCFMMGSSDEELDYAVNVLSGESNLFTDEQPEHEQCLETPFWIDKYEVSQSMFEQMGGVKERDNSFTGDNRPVERITWFEARDFCQSRDGRLPTEKEWEYAASGVDDLYYPWGNEWNEDYAIWDGNSGGRTTVVGSLSPESASWVGAYDMAGNVYEWVSSLYQDYQYDSTHENHADISNRRVLRGGSWFNIDTSDLRASDRNGDNPTNSFGNFGFRCVRSSTNSPPVEPVSNADNDSQPQVGNSASNANESPPTLSPIELAMQRAQAGVSSNDEWEAWYPEGFVQEFDGVEMLLVPTGCFMMGISDEQIDYSVNVLEADRDWFEGQKPVHEQCVNNPFWIDKYEVTEGDFRRLGGIRSPDFEYFGNDIAMRYVTWFEARDYCSIRQGRLPTEKDWEYAASGPSNLYFPWGNEWNADYVLWSDNYDNLFVTVGSLSTESTSWIGAYDMSGNVTEWVSSLNNDYEYDETHEDETDISSNRIMRGGFYGTGNLVFLSTSYRMTASPTSFSYIDGFRCVRDG